MVSDTFRPVQSLGFLVGFVLLAAAIGVAAMKFGPVMPVVAGVAVLFGVLFLVRPDAGLMIFVALTYANAAAVLGETTGQPVVLGAVFMALLCIPVFVNWFVKKRGLVIDRPLLLMIAFLAVLFISAIFSKDPALALSWITTYLLEGVILYFLLINSIRRLATLKAVLATLIIVCALLSSLSIYQEVTHSYDQGFGGFVERNLARGEGHETDSVSGFKRSRESILIANRATGPAGGPNRYAQILLIVLPIAMVQMWSGKTRRVRILNMVASLLILSTIFLTYSRGGFLSMVLLIATMVALGYFRIRHVLAGVVLVALFTFVLAPGYVSRMDSMRGMSRFTENKGEKKKGDSAIRGRLTEMLAAYNVWRDHPVLGVGPGHFSPYYSVDYMSDPEVAFRNIDSTRRAHILYFELAAETGVIGLVLFLAIAFHVARALWDLRRRWRKSRPDLSQLATGLFLGLMSYYTTALFLHLSYQRYYWLVLAIAASGMHILRRLEPEEALTDERADASVEDESARVPAVLEV